MNFSWLSCFCVCVCVVCAVYVYTSERTRSSASLLLLYWQSDNSSSDNMTYTQTTISHNNKTTCLVLCRHPNKHKTSGVVVGCLALGCWQWIFQACGLRAGPSMDPTCSGTFMLDQIVIRGIFSGQRLGGWCMSSGVPKTVSQQNIAS